MLKERKKERKEKDKSLPSIPLININDLSTIPLSDEILEFVCDICKISSLFFCNL